MGINACLSVSHIETHGQEKVKGIQEYRPSRGALGVIDSARKLNDESKVTEAIKLLEDFSTKEADPLVLFTMGNYYFDQSQYERAITNYRKALAEVPIFPQCKKNIGKAFFALKQYKEAIEEFKAVITEEQEDRESLLLLGQSYYFSDNVIPALEVFKKLLVLEAEKLEPRIWIIHCLLKMSQYQEAGTVCEESLKLYPTDRSLLELLGSIYTARSRYGEAIDIFKLLEMLGKLSPEKQLTLADLYMNQEMYPDAVRAYESAFKSKQPNEDKMLRLAYAKWFSRDPEGALKVCGEILKLWPQNYKAHLLQGQILLESGKAEQALTAFQEAISIKAGVGEAFLGMGKIYLERKDLLNAQNCFRQASQTKETQAAGLAGLGEVAYAKGDIDESIKYYHAALASEPGNKYYYNVLVDLEKLKQYEEAKE